MTKNNEYLDQFIATKAGDPLALALLTKFREIHRDCETSENKYSAALKQTFEDHLIKQK